MENSNYRFLQFKENAWTTWTLGFSLQYIQHGNWKLDLNKSNQHFWQYERILRKFPFWGPFINFWSFSVLLSFQILWCVLLKSIFVVLLLQPIPIVKSNIVMYRPNLPIYVVIHYGSNVLDKSKKPWFRS